MLDRMLLHKLNLQDCQAYREYREEYLDLTNRRIERLKATQARNPDWTAYCKYADDMVSIDIRIEEQLAVKEDLELEIEQLSQREESIKKEAALQAKRIKLFKRESSYQQLELFPAREN